jgi:hypothetical protein
MTPRVAISALFASALLAAAVWAAPVELEVATERGLQVTAPHEWLQLLTSAGVAHVRIRSASRGEQPSLKNRGTDERPQYHVVGILTARQQLLLPGGTFGRSDGAKLKDYFDRLASDGGEGVVAPRGRFDLTEAQFRALHNDLSRPVGLATSELTLKQLIEKLSDRFQHEIRIDRSVSTAMAQPDALGEELQNLTVGTGLALALRKYHLGLQPHKPRGAGVVLRVVPLGPEEFEERLESLPSKVWPVGWEAEARPRELAPKLFEYVNARIAGYSLREALGLLESRIAVPIFLDQSALHRHQIDADQLQIEFPLERTYYKRVLDRILFQARLHAELRVDEAGTVFYWVTR